MSKSCKVGFCVVVGFSFSLCLRELVGKASVEFRVGQLTRKLSETLILGTPGN